MFLAQIFVLLSKTSSYCIFQLSKMTCLETMFTLKTKTNIHKPQVSIRTEILNYNFNCHLPIQINSLNPHRAAITVHVHVHVRLLNWNNDWSKLLVLLPDIICRTLNQNDTLSLLKFACKRQNSGDKSSVQIWAAHVMRDVFARDCKQY